MGMPAMGPPTAKQASRCMQRHIRFSSAWSQPLAAGIGRGLQAEAQDPHRLDAVLTHQSFQHPVRLYQGLFTRLWLARNKIRGEKPE